MVSFTFVLLATPLAAEAQEPAKVPRVGYVLVVPSSSGRPLLEAFRRGLRERGYIDAHTGRRGDPMISRRVFIASVAALAAPLAAEAQPGGTLPRVGYLASFSGGTRTPTGTARTDFEQILRDLGWVNGQNVIIEFRFAEGSSEAPSRRICPSSVPPRSSSSSTRRPPGPWGYPFHRRC